MGNENAKEIKENQNIEDLPRDSRLNNLASMPRDSKPNYEVVTDKSNQMNQYVQKEYYVQSAYNGQSSQEYYQEGHYNPHGPEDSLKKRTYEVYRGQGAQYEQKYEDDRYAGYSQENIERIPTHMKFESSSADKVRAGRGQVEGGENIRIRDTENYVEVPLGYRLGTERKDINYLSIGRNGMAAGIYKFGVVEGEGRRGLRGLREREAIEIQQEDYFYPSGNIALQQEEIMEEIKRRTRKSGPGKKTCELIDKFYAVTEVDAKSIRKRQQEEKLEEERRYKLHASGAGYKAGAGAGAGAGYRAEYSEMRMGGKGEGGYKYEYSAQMQGQSGKLSKRSGYGSSYRIQGGYPIDNYSKYIFEQINKIRSNPQSFIGVIQDSKVNITRDRHGRLIYKGKKKVALVEGESAFDEAIQFLKSSEPMEKLTFSSEITVEPPRYENDVQDKTDLRKKVEYMTESGINIKAYWRDIIKDPELSLLLMIVDDTGSKKGLRRRDILDPDMKYIGISSAEIDGKFVCYLTLSPELY